LFSENWIILKIPMFSRLKHTIARWSIASALEHNSASGLLLSVIVGVGDRSSYLDLSLACLEQQVLPERFWEVVVSAHGSNPETANVFTRYAERHSNWKMITSRGGAINTLNAALEASRGRILVFLEEDCLALPDLLARHALYHQAEEGVLVGSSHRAVYTHLFSGSDPALPGVPLTAGVGASTFSRPDWPNQASLRQFEYHGATDYAPLHTYFETLNMELPHPWYYFQLRNASVPRQAFDLVGGFDVAYAGRDASDWSIHEKDFAMRLYEHGFKFRFDSQAQVLHQAHPYSPPPAYLRMRDVRTMLCKHPSLEASRITPLLMAV
jgi:glycosyltransferase involved in cell wall biosynthesis